MSTTSIPADELQRERSPRKQHRVIPAYVTMRLCNLAKTTDVHPTDTTTDANHAGEGNHPRQVSGRCDAVVRVHARRSEHLLNQVHGKLAQSRATL